MAKLIIAKNLTLAYEDKPIINKVNFTINTGDFVFITGKSGSGKTTLLKSFYGELKPIGGSLMVGGFALEAIKRKQLSHLRKHLGVVFQDFKLIPEWNILKNVMLPILIAGQDRKTSEHKAKEMLKKVNLLGLEHKYPSQLSGGEQQRAAIARATIHQPILILADEPISGLDEYSAEIVMNLFEKANKAGITIVIASHSIPHNFSQKYRHFHINEGKIHELS
ncbi:MAG: ABC transporter ATP-binding protein [Nautiliaceae bacterium]